LEEKKMVKTHPYSRFTIKDIEAIRDTWDILLQIEKIGTTFSGSGKELYLCEIVDSGLYNKSSTTERLTDEIVRVNEDNRRLRNRNERLEKDIRKLKAAGGAE
jgi:hypothetical protein